MQRVLTTATLVGLLIATAAAFAITERLKLVKSPIYGTIVEQWLSPTCGCRHGKATISFKLRQGDTVTIQILDSKRDEVRLLAGSQPVTRGRTVFLWDGRTNLGERAADGVYRAQVHLDRQHRTILLPNLIRLDTTPPEVLDARPDRGQISPDGDRIGDTVSIRYRLSKKAHAVVYLGAQRIIRSKSSQPNGAVLWTGRVDGEVLPAGTYTLGIGAVDLAGNVTPVAERARVRVQIRYVELAADRIVVGAGKLFSVGVSTDAKSYAWRLANRTGTWTGPVLGLRAPRSRGRYTLTVSYLGHSTRAAVIVR